MNSWRILYDDGKGDSIRKIAKDSGFSFGTVRTALIEAGADIPPPGGRAGRPRTPRHPDAAVRQAMMTKAAWAVLHVLNSQERRFRIREIRDYVTSTANDVQVGARTLEMRGYAEKSVVDRVGWYKITASGQEAVKTEPAPDIYRPIKGSVFATDRAAWDDRARRRGK
ncbi:helix-turn-helix domain-containing protein [Kibdelosporangium persicum]